MKSLLVLAASLLLAGCTAKSREPRAEAPHLRFTWDTSAELAKFPKASTQTFMALDLRPLTHEMPTPPFPYPHHGLVFTGAIVFSLVIDEEGVVLAAFPKSVDGRCRSDLQTLEEHVLKHMSTALLKWTFATPNGTKPGKQVAVELPIILGDGNPLKK